MDDREIIQLYINKNEKAIQETEKKYRTYLLKIAMNILGNLEDSEECLNDTYMSAWMVLQSFTVMMRLIRVWLTDSCSLYATRAVLAEMSQYLSTQ